MKSLFENGTMTSVVSKQERTVKQHMKVRVYRNLNKPSFYSILAREGEFKGKVVGYARSVSLSSAKLVVSEASRQRILREGRKNVHAFCEGFITGAFDEIQDTSNHEYITYNPYAMGTFFNPETNQPVTEVPEGIVIQSSGVYFN